MKIILSFPSNSLLLGLWVCNSEIGVKDQGLHEEEEEEE